MIAKSPMRRTEALTIGVLLVLYAVSVLDRQVVALLVESIKADLHLSDVQFSALQGIAFALFYSLFALPIGVLVDKYPRRWIVYVGVTCWSLATAACGLTKTFPQMFFARAAVGAGEASLAPAAQSILADTFPPERLSFAMSLFVMGAGIGTGLAFLVGGPVVDMVTAWGAISLPWFGELAPWRTVMLLVGLPGLLVAFAIFLLPEPVRKSLVPAAGKAAGGVSYFQFVRKHWKFLVTHNGGFALLQVALIGIQLWMPAYLSRSFGWTPGQGGLWIGGIMILAALIGLPVHGWVVDRLYRGGARNAHMTWYGCICLVTAPVALLTFLSGSEVMAIGGYALLYLLLVGGPSIGPAALQIVCPGNLRGKMAATYMLTTGLVGSAVGPMAVAAVTDLVLKDEARLGVSLGVVGAGATALAGLLLLLGRRAMTSAVNDIQTPDTSNA